MFFSIFTVETFAPPRSFSEVVSKFLVSNQNYFVHNGILCGPSFLYIIPHIGLPTHADLPKNSYLSFTFFLDPPTFSLGGNGLHDADWICNALCRLRATEECKEHVSLFYADCFFLVRKIDFSPSFSLLGGRWYNVAC